MPGGNASASCRTRCWASPGSSRWRCSSVAAGCSANVSPVTKVNRSSTSRRRRCRCDAGSTNRPGCTTPTSPSTRSVTPSCGQRSTPSSPRSNRPTATPAPPSTCLLADAVVDAVSGERSGDRRVPEICVHIDYDTMLNGLHELSVCETADGIPLPPETVRRLACEAAIVPIVLNGAGEVLDCGREVRVANRAQRRALRAMYRTCGYPGCDVTFERCDIHHVIEWLRHGTHRSRQSPSTCARKHHHLVHEGRWRLTLDKHRVHHHPPTRRHPTLPRHHHQPHEARLRRGQLRSSGGQLRVRQVRRDVSRLGSRTAPLPAR